VVLLVLDILASLRCLRFLSASRMRSNVSCARGISERLILFLGLEARLVVVVVVVVDINR